MHQAPQRSRRPALIAAAFLIVAATGVIVAIALGGDDTPGQQNAANPPATATPTGEKPTATPGASSPQLDKEITIGRRPNVVRVADGNVFVGSFRSDRLRIVSAKTFKPRAYAPRVGFGVNDAAVSGNSIWLAIARDQQLVRLDTRTGRPIGSPIKMPYPVRDGRGDQGRGLGRTRARRRAPGPARQGRPEDRKDRSPRPITRTGSTR